MPPASISMLPPSALGLTTLEIMCFGWGRRSKGDACPLHWTASPSRVWFEFLSVSLPSVSVGRWIHTVDSQWMFVKLHAISLNLRFLIYKMELLHVQSMLVMRIRRCVYKITY